MSQVLLVHPRPYSGESLTSFVIRTAFANQISVRELWSEFNSKFRKAHLKDVHQLDLDPYRVCDMQAFSRLTLLDERDFSMMTFRPMFEKFLDLDEMSDDRSRRDFCQNMLETAHRRYCPMCIAEKPVYFLAWQVKEITVCLRHTISLLEVCPHCGKSLNLVHLDLAIGKCQHCGSALGEFAEIVAPDVSQAVDTTFEIQQRIYKDWTYLLDPNERGLSFSGGSRRKSLSIVLLRVAQPEGEEMDTLRITGMKNEHANRLVRFVRGKKGAKRPTLAFMLSVVRGNLSLSELPTIRPSEIFTESVLNSDPRGSDKQSDVCLCPWCMNFETNLAMEPLPLAQNRFKGQLGGSFKDPYICLGCSTRYGHEVESGEWKEVDGFVEIGWKQVLPELNSGKSRRQVSLELGIGPYHITRMAGYFAAVGLLAEQLAQPFVFVPESGRPFVDHFKEASDKGQLMSKVCGAYGWTQAQFWFGFYQSEVQKYLLLQRDQKRGPSKVPEEKASVYWTKRFYEELDACLQEGVELDLEMVAGRVGCPVTTLTRYKLSRILTEARYKQQLEQQDYYWKKSKQFVGQCMDKGERIILNDYFAYVGRTEKWLNKRFPEVVSWVKGQIAMASEIHQRAVLEERILLIEASVRKLQSQGKPYGIKDVAQDIGINAATISFYKELTIAAREAAVSVELGGYKDAGS